VKQACEKSLKRLGVSCIDLYYAHRVDGITPVEVMVQDMKELRDEGKIRYLGMSTVSASPLRRACKVCHISAVQMEYSHLRCRLSISNRSLEDGEGIRHCCCYVCAVGKKDF